jgi:hypothetical protein
MHIQATRILMLDGYHCKNFIAINHDGKLYEESINIRDESVVIPAPIGQLIQYETTIKQHTVDRGEI